MSEENKIEEAISLLVSKGMNDFSYKEHVTEAFVALSRQHRTLQQSFWRMIFGLITEYAKLEYFDDRNEQAVITCKAIIKGAEKEFDFEWKVIANLPTI